MIEIVLLPMQIFDEEPVGCQRAATPSAHVTDDIQPVYSAVLYQQYIIYTWVALTGVRRA